MEGKYIVVLCFGGITVAGVLIAVIVGAFSHYLNESRADQWNKQDYPMQINTTYKSYKIMLWTYNIYGHDDQLESLHDSEQSRRIYGMITKWECFPSFHIIKYRKKWQFYTDPLIETLNFAKTMIDDGSIDRWFDTVTNLDEDQLSEFIQKQNREEFKMTSNRPKIF